MKCFGWSFILACAVCSAQTVATIGPQGDPANRIDLAIVGDGYTAAELPRFTADANKFAQTFFAAEFYKEYAGYFNLRTVAVASNQSGASHPELVPPVSRDTAFSASFDCQGIVRLICVDGNKVNAVVATVLPANQRDYIVVLVNDSVYGGSGGAFFVTSTNIAAPEVILHESGHTIGLLADEYTSQPPPCSLTNEPTAANSTLQSDRSLVKWSPWIAASTPVPTTTVAPGVPGIYPGADYCPAGKYRPTNNSKMNNLGQPFEQINSEQMVRRFYNIVSGIDGFSPAVSPVSVKQGEQSPFSITPLAPATHTLDVSWSIDGAAVSTGAHFNLDTSQLTVGTHSLVATVHDPTSFVRTDPSGLLSDKQTWQVNVATSDALPVVSTLTISPASVFAGGVATVSFTLSGPALTGGPAIAFTTSSAVFPIPATYALQPGQKSGSFPVPVPATVPASVSVTVTASLDGSSRSAIVNVTPPGPAIQGVAGAALSAPSVQQLTSNGIFAIFGSLFAPAGTSRVATVADLVGNALPTNLAQTCVLVNGTRAPLSFVSPGQINALAPALPVSGSVVVSVISRCDLADAVASASVNVPVSVAAPEFLYFALRTDGRNPVAAIQALSGSYVAETGLLTGVISAPAHAGDTLTIFGVGFGPTKSTDPIGTIVTAATATTGAASVTIGGIPAEVTYTGLTPTTAGLYQVNVVVPSNVAAGAQQIVIKVNGGTSPGGPYITIAP